MVACVKMSNIVSTTSSSTVPTLDLIEILDLLISDLFLNTSEHNQIIQQKNYLKESMFYLSKAKTSISFKDYMRRIQSFTKCSNEVFIIAFIYFDRIIQKNAFHLQKLNVHKY